MLVEVRAPDDPFISINEPPSVFLSRLGAYKVQLSAPVGTRLVAEATIFAAGVIVKAKGEALVPKPDAETGAAKVTIDIETPETDLPK